MDSLNKDENECKYQLTKETDYDITNGHAYYATYCTINGNTQQVTKHWCDNFCKHKTIHDKLI